MRAMERSAVFMVPKMYTFFGTENSSWEYGRVTDIASSSPSRFESSIKVISSPNILEIFPRLISSIMKTYLLLLSLAALLQNSLKTPSEIL